MGEATRGELVKTPTRREAQRHLAYALQLAGPPRTEANLYSDLDRDPEDRNTTQDNGDPPLVLTRRAVASLAVVLAYLLSLVDQAERWATAVVLASLILLGGVCLSIGASVGAAVAVYQMQAH